jgi:hypothetical protein
LRFLYELGPDFEGFTPGAAWEDLRLGMRSMRLFDGCAVLTDHPFLREAIGVANFLMPCPIRVFPSHKLEDALQWLQRLPGSGIIHQFVGTSGVLLVELTDTLRKQDFEELSLAADAWIDAHGKLTGIVVHAREFPGWENFGAMLRHLQFVRNHHRKVERVAVVSDARLASIAPALAERFVDAEVKSFAYSELERAIAWVRSGAIGKIAAGDANANEDHQGQS